MRMRKKLIERNSGRKVKKSFNAGSFNRFGMFVIAALLMVLVITYDKSTQDVGVRLDVGEPAKKDVYSPCSFTYVDEEATILAKEIAAREVPSVYRVDTKINQAVIKQLALLREMYDRHAADTEADLVMPDGLNNILSEPSMQFLLDEKAGTKFFDVVASLVAETLEQGLLSFPEKIQLLDKANRVIVLKRENDESLLNVLDIASLNEARDKMLKSSLSTFPRSRKLRALFAEVGDAVFQPNIVFDDKETLARKEAAFELADPIEGRIRENEVILRKGMLVTEPVLRRLDQVQQYVRKQRFTLQTVSVGVVVFMAVSLLGLFLRFFEPKYYYDSRNVLLVLIIIVLTLVLNKGVIITPELASFLVPGPLAAILVAILLTPHIGLFVGVIMSLLTASMVQYEPMIMLAILCASMLGVFSVMDMRRRSQFFVVGLVVGLTYFLLMLAYAMWQDVPVIEAIMVARWGFLNGAIITILLFPTVFIFENMFDITTKMSLLELSDLNHPLLKRLIIEAPGTYHHSLVVSNLAESACESIGANALLARVGAYFHDIGKIEKAEYFTENQTANVANVHDSLSPRMSYFIIVNHVKDGLALARNSKYKLKKVIMDFIEQHHGTSMVYYFYKKAKDAEDKDNGEEIKSIDYRYSGPKPQTKETAITLLADSVEAASRSLSSPTPSSIRGLVEKVINDKFIDNQIDECDLTLTDLHKIKESFIRNLMAIFHTRVEYPEMPKTRLQ